MQQIFPTGAKMQAGDYTNFSFSLWPSPSPYMLPWKISDSPKPQGAAWKRGNKRKPLLSFPAMEPYTL